MSTFFDASTLFRELGEPGGSPGALGGAAGGPPGGMGGPPGAGGPPGGPPPMGGGGMGMGGPPGGGMGGGEGQPPQAPMAIKSIPAADVWKLLEKIIKDDKYDKFFKEININKPKNQTVYSKKEEPKNSSLQK